MTKISEITIENFRGIKKAEIKQLDQVNIFIGKNGAGKSTILEAIYLASAWINPSSMLQDINMRIPNRKIDYIIYRRGMRGNWEKYRSFLFFMQDISNPIKIETSFGQLKLRFEIIGRDRDGNVFINLADVLTQHDFYYYEELLKYVIDHLPSDVYLKLKEKIGMKNIRMYLQDTIESRLAHYPLYSISTGCYKDYEGNTVTDLIYRGLSINDLVRDFLKRIIREEISYLSDVILLDRLIVMLVGKYEKVFWPRILAKRYDKLLVKMLREGLEEGVEGLTYVPIDDEYVLVAQLPETSIRVDDLGEGARDALLIMMPVLVSKNTAILLEEPEAHLHPGGLYLFLKYLFYAARERNLQLFITTHSIELVNMALSIGEEDKIGVKVFYVERDKNGVVDTRILEKVDVETLQKLGLDPRFLGVI